MRIRKSSFLTVLAAISLVAFGAVAADAATNANQKAAKKGADYLNSRSMTAFPITGFKADAVSALSNLGLKRPEAERAVARARALLGEGAALNDLITRAIQESAR